MSALGGAFEAGVSLVESPGGGRSEDSADERRTLAAVAAVGLPGCDIDFPEQPLTPGPWRTVVDAASSGGVLGLLSDAARVGSLPVTSAQRHQLALLDRQGQSLSLVLERSLLAAAAELERGGIGLRVMGDIAVSRLDYRDPSLRHVRRIGILVLSEDLAPSIHALAPLGWRRRSVPPTRTWDTRFGGAVVLVEANGLELDLHRSLADPPCGLGIPPADLWGDPDSFPLGSRRLSTLPPEYRLVEACVATVTAGSQRSLAYERDIVELLCGGKVPAPVFFALVSRWRLGVVAACAVQRAWATLGVQEAHRVSAWAQHYEANRWERTLIGRLSDPSVGYLARGMAGTRLVPDPANRIAYMRALAWPSRRYRRGRVGRLFHGGR